MMNNNTLLQRQRWFRLFPEGSIEFLVATRLLVMILLLALLIIGNVQVQLLASLVALTAVLWLDYVLVVWWAVQIAIDLQEVILRQSTNADALRRRRIRAGIVVCLPSTVAAMIIAPWPTLLHFFQAELLPDATMAVARVVAALLFIVLVIWAQRTMRRIGLGSRLWTLLLLIPVLHWFAMHRLMVGLERRLRESEMAVSAETEHEAADGPELAVAIADVTWALAVLPWSVLMILVLIGGSWPTEFPQAAVPFCGVPLAAIFAVADLAAMERVQRQFVTTLRKC